MEKESVRCGCRCCGWIYYQVVKGEVTISREECTCSGYFCERCKKCLDHHTCGLPWPQKSEE